MPKKRRIIIVAGPNGAGKTTFAREYLLKEADCPDFVNLDLIAAGLSPFDPDIAIARVAARVKQGGHNVASAIVRRRFEAGLRNFQDIYMDLVDTWEWYDNSDGIPRLMAAGANPR